MPPEGGPHPSTLCARPGGDPPSATAPLVPPLQLSAVYRIEGLDQVDALYAGHQAGFVSAVLFLAGAASLVPLEGAAPRVRTAVLVGHRVEERVDVPFVRRRLAGPVSHAVPPAGS